ncbi:MAG: 2-methylcitrate dehydratase [Rhodoglobus sp.]|nr:2-methylcitrate dehydratase [Rhodoglobus sp.]
MSSDTYADRLAGYLVNLSTDALPTSVIRTAEICAMDYLGVVLAGQVTPASAMVTELARDQGGSRDATLFGKADRVPAPGAALVNGTTCHSIELDDHEAHMRSKIHGGAVVFSAAWAVAEARPTSGADFLTAVVAGYEAFGRLSGATDYPDYLGRVKGFHTTPLFGPFAAAAAAGRLIGLTAAQLSNAFGIAGSLSSGLQETVRAGAMVKPLHAGWAAQSGVIAAQLAAKGFTGPRTIFEGSKGFFQAFCGEGHYDLDVIDARFGEDFDISLTMFKPYACGGGIHPVLTAIDQLRTENAISPDEVTRVIVRTSQHAVDFFCTPWETKVAPTSGSQAQHSMPFAVAVLLWDGVALLEQFTNDSVKRPEVLALAAKIVVEVDETISSDDPEDEPASVEIHLGDRVFTRAVRGGKGSLAVPMSEAELTDKFRRLTEPVLGSAASAALENRVLGLRNDPDVSDLPSSLTYQ